MSQGPTPQVLFRTRRPKTPSSSQRPLPRQARTSFIPKRCFCNSRSLLLPSLIAQLLSTLAKFFLPACRGDRLIAHLLGRGSFILKSRNCLSTAVLFTTARKGNPDNALLREAP